MGIEKTGLQASRRTVKFLKGRRILGTASYVIGRSGRFPSRSSRLEHGDPLYLENVPFDECWYYFGGKHLGRDNQEKKS